MNFKIAQITDEYLERCLNGEELFGDHFDGNLIAEWFQAESEGYYRLLKSDGSGTDTYQYSYHALNWYHAFRHLSERSFQSVLGLGSAYGDEFLPVANKIGKLTILEPSERFATRSILPLAINYRQPSVTGELPCETGEFSLATSLGVLHHIPNVSYVVAEIYRCLRPGGYFVLREPIHSMGDWRKSRRGLTKNERGIPADILWSIVTSAGFSAVRKHYCCFPLIPRLRFFSNPVYNSWALVQLDAALSAIFSFNRTYHAKSILQKVRPTSVYWMLQKKA